MSETSKLIFLCIRRGGVSHEGFTSKLVAEAGPALVARLAPRSLAVSLIDEAQAEFPPYDGICEIASPDPARHADVERELAPMCSRIDVYAVSDFVARDDLGGLAPGRFAGVKAFYPIVRKPGTTKDEFVRHWREVHVPKARKHHPGMKRYVQNVVVSRLSSTGEDWDGFTEGWYPSEKEYTENMFDSPEGLRVIMDDVAQFIGRVGTYRTTEHVLA